MERSHRILLALALILASAAIFLSAVLFTRLASTTERTNRALCTFRSDVRQRAANGEAFLADHPQGIAGIPAATLRQSIDGQRRTIRALSGLGCKPE